MRVALFLDAPRPGGAERYFADLCRGLARLGVEVHALSPAGPVIPYLESRLSEDVWLHVLTSRRVYDVGFVGNSMRALEPLGELRETLAAVTPDIFHISNGGYPGSHLCRAAVFATRRPRIMTVNNRAQERIGARGLAYRVLDRIVWRSVARIICPSEATGETLVAVRDAPREKLRVVYYGIEQPAVDDEAMRTLRRELGADETHLLVGMVAAPEATSDAVYKGHHVLLEALGIAARHDIVTTIVGHDPGEAFRRRADELGISDRVHVHAGFRESSTYMKSFDVLAVPSIRNEALPVVMLEAMAYGKPVLGSRLSGIPEAVVDDVSGWTFEPGDSATLAKLIARCASDRELLARVGEGARRRFEELFSLDRMVKKTLEVYEQARGSLTLGLDSPDA